MKMFTLENDSQLNDIIDENKYTHYIIQLSATWCRPCLQITPSVKEHVSTINNDSCVYIYADVDKCPNLYQYLKTNGIPGFIIMKRNETTGLYDVNKITTNQLYMIKQFFDDNDIYNSQQTPTFY